MAEPAPGSSAATFLDPSSPSALATARRRATIHRVRRGHPGPPAVPACPPASVGAVRFEVLRGSARVGEVLKKQCGGGGAHVGEARSLSWPRGQSRSAAIGTRRTSGLPHRPIGHSRFPLVSALGASPVHPVVTCGGQVRCAELRTAVRTASCEDGPPIEDVASGCPLAPVPPLCRPGRGGGTACPGCSAPMPGERRWPTATRQFPTTRKGRPVARDQPPRPVAVRALVVAPSRTAHPPASPACERPAR